LKEEAVGHTLCRTHFGRNYGLVIRQTTEWMKLRKLGQNWIGEKCRDRRVFCSSLSQGVQEGLNNASDKCMCMTTQMNILMKLRWLPSSVHH
jgi:hypothetical protein